MNLEVLLSNHDCPRLPCSGSFFYLVLVNCRFPIELDLERMTTPLSLPRPFAFHPSEFCVTLYTRQLYRSNPPPLRYCSSSSKLQRRHGLFLRPSSAVSPLLSPLFFTPSSAPFRVRISFITTTLCPLWSSSIVSCLHAP